MAHPRKDAQEVAHGDRGRTRQVNRAHSGPQAGTDKADATDMREAQQQLGHKSVKTTEIYLRARAGAKVTPTK
jgi:integrase